MRRARLALIVMTTFLGLPAAFAVEPDVPTFQATPTCRTEADGSRKTDAVCLADERAAHEQLVQQWPRFPATAKQQCLAASTDIAGMSSYVELLTCLQLTKDVNSLPAIDKE